MTVFWKLSLVGLIVLNFWIVFVLVKGESEKCHRLTEQQLCTAIECNITCNTCIESLQIQRLAQKSNCELIDLTIECHFFPNYHLSQSWIHGNFKIGSLKIVDSKLAEIDENAFSSQIFENTTELIIANVYLKNISDNSFKGLNSLQNLILSINNPDNLKYSKNYLDVINETLTTLKFDVVNKIVPTQVQRILRMNTLRKIKIVDLSNNRFGAIDDDDVFIGIQDSIEKLYLNCSHILYLETGIFKGFKHLKYLDVRSNYLWNLPGDLLKLTVPRSEDVITGKASSIFILLEHNLIHCTCEHSSLLIYAIQENPLAFDSDNAACAEPPEVASILIRDLGHCIQTLTSTTPKPSTSTLGNSTTDTTRSMSESISTTLAVPTQDDENDWDKEYIHIDCRDNHRDVSKIRYFKMKSPTIDFIVERYSSNAVRIRIFYPRKNIYTVIWYSNATVDYIAMEMNYNDYGLGCRVTPEQGEIIIENLQEDHVYVICIFEGQGMDLSPFNCHSHFLVPLKSKNSDGSLSKVIEIYEDHEVVIIILISSVLFLMLTGLLVIFILIRCKPKILDVLMKKEIILVKQYSTDNKTRQEVGSRKNNIKGSKSFERTFLHNNEKSKSYLPIYSDLNYVVPSETESHSYEVIKYQKEKRIEKQRSYFEYISSIPAQLPPPVPKRLSQESMKTNSTASTSPLEGDTLFQCSEERYQSGI